MHGIDSRGVAFSFCTCGQGYSGKNHYDRLIEHIHRPTAETLGALIAQISKMEG